MDAFNFLSDGVYSTVDRTIEDSRWEYGDWEYYLQWGVVKENGFTRVDYVLNVHGQGVGLLDEEGTCSDILIAVADVDRFETWLKELIAKAVNYSEYEPGEDVRYQLPWDDARVGTWDFCRRAAAYYVNCVPKAALDPELKKLVDQKYDHVGTATEEMLARITASIKNVLMRFAQNVVVEAERTAIKKKEAAE